MKKISNCLEWLKLVMKQNSNFLEWLTHKFKKQRKLLKLYPIDDANIKVYEEMLDEAFSDNNIKNIAISGRYGIGKSSVIKSYEKQRKKRFAYVSMTPFGINEHETGVNQQIYPKGENKGIRYFSNNTFENEAEMPSANFTKNTNWLEIGILNQILYQVDSRKIKASALQRKEDMSPIKAILIFLYFFLSLLTLTYCFLYIYHRKDLDIPIFSSGMFLFIGAVFIVLTSCFIYKIYTYLHHKKLIKINIAGNELTMSEDKVSIFDKYISEVIYIFTKLDVSALVIEDIDRYKNAEIFENLRYLNLLVNNELKNQGKSLLKFIYAVDDSTLCREDRIKFFDVIIPILPLATSSNICLQLKSFFETHRLAGVVDEVLINRLSIYIDEFRVLNSILNEFLIHEEIISTRKSNQLTDKNHYNKLLSAIAVKILLPGLYSAAINKKGYIHKAVLLFNIKAQGMDFDTPIYQQIPEAEEMLIDLKKYVGDKYMGFLKFTLTKSYLTEDYLNYLTITSEFSLTERDQNFIKSVDLGERNNFGYVIDNPAIVLENLHCMKDFGSQSFFNMDLMDFMLMNQNDLDVAKKSLQNFKKSCEKNIVFPNLRSTFLDFYNLYSEYGKKPSDFKIEFEEIYDKVLKYSRS